MQDRTIKRLKSCGSLQLVPQLTTPSSPQLTVIVAKCDHLIPALQARTHPGNRVAVIRGKVNRAMDQMLFASRLLRLGFTSDQMNPTGWFGNFNDVTIIDVASKR